jgi:hypothetical protein
MDIESICGACYVDDYYSFSLVRHPVSRLCSMYNFVGTILSKWAAQNGLTMEEIPEHITPRAAKKKPSLKWGSSRAFLTSKSFSEFIRHKDLAMAPGFRTQVSSLVGHSKGRLRAQFFRLEDHATWITSLGDRLGIQLDLPHANDSGIKMMREELVSANDRSYIESKFRDDFEAFGYRQ